MGIDCWCDLCSAIWENPVIDVVTAGEEVKFAWWFNCRLCHSWCVAWKLVLWVVGIGSRCIVCAASKSSYFW